VKETSAASGVEVIAIAGKRPGIDPSARERRGTILRPLRVGRIPELRQAQDGLCNRH